MEHRKPSEEYASIASELIASEPLLASVRDSSVSIVYLVSDKEKTSRRRTVHAECERVPDKWRWCCDHDFAITVYAPNVERMDAEQVRLLMLHELMHVGVERDGNEESYFTVPHDVEDFRVLLEEHGIGWADR